jgi:hypothetical protein
LTTRATIVVGVLAAGFLFVLLPVRAQQQRPSLVADSLPAQARSQLEAVMAEKAQRTPAQRKVSSNLLYARKIRRGESIADGVNFLRSSVDISADGLVIVDIQANVTTEILARIVTLGGRTISSVPAYRAVRAAVPIDAIETIAAMNDVQFIRPADEMMTQGQRPLSRATVSDSPVTNKTNTSEGDIAHRAPTARATYNVTGAGISIGVMSDGVNTLAERQSTGDLPAVNVLSGKAGSGDEGTAMLEIVYDLAPGDDLFFATANGGQAQFAANIEALCDAGADIIVDDVFYFAESVFQDGIVAQGVNNAVADGCHYFSAAGNSGNKNDGTSGVWEGDFFAAASNPPGLGAGDTAHDFGSGNNSNQITLDTPYSFILQWSDPRGGSSNDYDLCIFTPGMVLAECSTNFQTGTQDPFEIISSAAFNDLNYRLVIVKNSGAANRFLHLNTIRGRLAISTSGQTAGHSAAANAYGVAAVNVATAAGGAFSGGSANPVRTYSSDGLRRIFFNSNGVAITPGNFSSSGGQLLQKPDIAAADGVSTATPGFNPFPGTSAAAPHAAAIAALMLQAAGGPGSLTVTELRDAMWDGALDIEGSGVDRDSGAGILMADAGVAQVYRVFADNPLVAGTTLVKTVHVTELRTRINLLRADCGLGQFTFTDTSLSGAIIKAIHITEMRTALNAAYAACGVAAPTYTDPTITGGSTRVKAAHITELRNAVVALE